MFRRTSRVLLLALLMLAACRQAPDQAPAATSPTTAPTLTPAPTAPPLPPQPPPGMLYVDAAYDLGAIPPTVYGTNYGPWITVPLALQEAYRQSQLHLLRFPGGAYGDEHNLRPLQIDQFVDLAAQIGAEPLISVRLFAGTLEQAVDLLRYTNFERDYGVRYWSIGNEPSLYATAYNAPEWDVDHYNAQWREFALALKAADPSILLFGPDTHQYTADPGANPSDSSGRDWMASFLAANGDLVDVVAFHRYPFPTALNAPATTIEQLRASTAEWDLIIPALRELIHEKTGRDLPLAVTEINSHWTRAIGGEATPDSHFSAIWWGDVLGRLIRNDVAYVAHFALQSPPSFGGWGLLARDDVRPGYYVYQMYAHFGDRLRFSAAPAGNVSLFAALDDEEAGARTLTLMLVNLADEAQTLPLQLDHFAPSGDAAIWLFDAAHNATSLAAEPLAGGTTLTLPPQSMTLYAIPGTVTP
ncbi:MAG: hypothetical protein RRC07_03380 [Anaerolineae bacterium]|nr:hypothetical protein [Anaerolineae bacterium]